MVVLPLAVEHLQETAGQAAVQPALSNHTAIVSTQQPTQLEKFVAHST
jgi:hypothetical protein